MQIMRTTSPELIYSLVKSPLQNITYLNLDEMGIENLEGLEICTSLITLSLNSNLLESLGDSLLRCRELWNLDVSDNLLKNMDGLDSFLAMGTVNLSNNKLTYKEIRKLCHMNILEIYLKGNKQLAEGKTDLEYRKKVLESIPSVWVLDGDYVALNQRRMSLTGWKFQENILAYDSLSVSVEGDEDGSAPQTQRLDQSSTPQFSKSPPQTAETKNFADDGSEATGVTPLSTQRTNHSTTVIPGVQEIQGPGSQQGSIVESIVSSLAEKDDTRPRTKKKKKKRKQLNLRLLGNFKSAAPGRLARNFLAKFERLPTNPDVVDTFRLRYLLESYEKGSRSQNDTNKQHGASQATQKIPLPYFKELQKLDFSTQVNVVVLLVAGVEFQIPPRVYLEAMWVTIAGQYLDRDEVKEITELPIFVKTAIAHLLHLQLMEELNSDDVTSYQFGIQETETLYAIPKVVTHTMSPVQTNQHDENLRPRARSAVLLLTSSPNCPVLSKVQNSTSDQRKYNELIPIINAGGFGYEDLDIEENRPVNDPSKLPWNRMRISRNYERGWAKTKESDKEAEKESSVRDNATSPSSRIAFEDEMLDDYMKEMYPEDYEQYGGSNGDETPTSDDEHELASKWKGVRMAKENEHIEVRVGKFAQIHQVEEDGCHFTVFPFDGQDEPPTQGNLTIAREEIIWDPRGWWKHLYAAKERADLHRINTGVHLIRPNGSLKKSGLPSNAGTSNSKMPLHMLEGMKSKKAMKPLKVFTSEASWDAAFVLAPPALVELQNQLGSNTHSWDDIDSRPPILYKGPETPFVKNVSATVKRLNQSKTLPNGIYPPKPSRGLQCGQPEKNLSFEDEWAQLQKSMGSFKRLNKAAGNFTASWERGLQRIQKQSSDADLVEKVEAEVKKIDEEPAGMTFLTGLEMPSDEEEERGKDEAADQSQPEQPETKTLALPPRTSLEGSHQSKTSSLTFKHSGSKVLHQEENKFVNDLFGMTENTTAEDFPNRIRHRPWHMMSSDSRSRLIVGKMNPVRTAPITRNRSHFKPSAKRVLSNTYPTLKKDFVKSLNEQVLMASLMQEERKGRHWKGSAVRSAPELSRSIDIDIPRASTDKLLPTLKPRQDMSRSMRRMRTLASSGRHESCDKSTAESFGPWGEMSITANSVGSPTPEWISLATPKDLAKSRTARGRKTAQPTPVQQNGGQSSDGFRAQTPQFEHRLQSPGGLSPFQSPPQTPMPPPQSPPVGTW